MLTKLKHKIYAGSKGSCFNSLRNTVAKQKMYFNVLSRFIELEDRTREALDLIRIREVIKEDLE